MSKHSNDWSIWIDRREVMNWAINGCVPIPSDVGIESFYSEHDEGLFSYCISSAGLLLVGFVTPWTFNIFRYGMDGSCGLNFSLHIWHTTLWGALALGIGIHVEFHDCPILNRWTMVNQDWYVCVFLFSSQIKLWVQACCKSHMLLQRWVARKGIPWFIPHHSTVSPCVWSSSFIQLHLQGTRFDSPRCFRCRCCCCCKDRRRNSSASSADSESAVSEDRHRFWHRKWECSINIWSWSDAVLLSVFIFSIKLP